MLQALPGATFPRTNRRHHLETEKGLLCTDDQEEDAPIVGKPNVTVWNDLEAIDTKNHTIFLENS